MNEMITKTLSAEKYQKSAYLGTLSHTLQIAEILCNEFFPNNRELFWQCMGEHTKHYVGNDEDLKAKVKDAKSQVERFALKLISGQFNFDILYFKGKKKCIQYELKDNLQKKHVILSGNLRSLEEMLPLMGFVRVHINCIVNKNHVVDVDDEYVYMDNFVRIPWGTTYHQKYYAMLAPLHKDDSKSSLDLTRFKDFEC